MNFEIAERYEFRRNGMSLPVMKCLERQKCKNCQTTKKNKFHHKLTRIATDSITDFSRTKGICENNLSKSEQSVVRKDEHRSPLFYCGLVEFIFYTLL